MFHIVWVYVYLIYNSFTAEDLKSKKNSLFIDLNYLRFVPFSNFFLSKINLLISSYVIYTFLPNTKNIYISHDIYDTPMVNKEIEKKHFIFLSKLDYIFVSSNIVKQYFENSFREYIKSRKIKKKAKIINTGYLKLDYVSNKLKKNSNVITDIIYKDLKTDIQTENDKSLISSIYDTTYNDIIKQII